MGPASDFDCGGRKAKRFTPPSTPDASLNPKIAGDLCPKSPKTPTRVGTPKSRITSSPPFRMLTLPCRLARRVGESNGPRQWSTNISVTRPHASDSWHLGKGLKQEGKKKKNGAFCLGFASFPSGRIRSGGAPPGKPPESSQRCSVVCQELPTPPQVPQLDRQAAQKKKKK